MAIETQKMPRKPRATVELGQRFGRLVVVAETKCKRGQRAWLCKCDCGGESTVSTSNLHNTTKSCGCNWRVPYLTDDTASFRKVWAKYRANGRKRGFHLTEAQVRELTSAPCHYCGAPPEQVAQAKNPKNPEYHPAPYKFNGIDRKDNEAGYTFANCLPACRTCNFLKGSLPYEEFIQRVIRVASHLKEAHGY